MKRRPAEPTELAVGARLRLNTGTGTYRIAAFKTEGIASRSISLELVSEYDYVRAERHAYERGVQSVLGVKP